MRCGKRKKTDKTERKKARQTSIGQFLGSYTSVIEPNKRNKQMNQTNEIQETEIKVDWDFIFKNSKVELWSLTLFLLFSVAASLLRLLQKRRHGNDRRDIETGPASSRPTDQVDGNDGRTAEIKLAPKAKPSSSLRAWQ